MGDRNGAATALAEGHQARDCSENGVKHMTVHRGIGARRGTSRDQPGPPQASQRCTDRDVAQDLALVVDQVAYPQSPALVCLSDSVEPRRSGRSTRRGEGGPGSSAVRMRPSNLIEAADPDSAVVTGAFSDSILSVTAVADRSAGGEPGQAPHTTTLVGGQLGLAQTRSDWLGHHTGRLSCVARNISGRSRFSLVG